MTQATLKKSMAWVTPDESSVELSRGYPLAKAISIARKSLSPDELRKLAADFLVEAESRSAPDET